MMTEIDLLRHIKEYVGKREVPFDDVLNHLNEKEPIISEDELSGILAKAGMLALQVNDSPLIVRVKEGVEKMPPNQNPNQAKVLERMKQGSVKIHPDQNSSRLKKS